jgi:hypothetical protein
LPQSRALPVGAGQSVLDVDAVGWHAQADQTVSLSGEIRLVSRTARITNQKALPWRTSRGNRSARYGAAVTDSDFGRRIHFTPRPSSREQMSAAGRHCAGRLPFCELVWRARCAQFRGPPSLLAAWWFLTLERTAQSQLMAYAAGTPTHEQIGGEKAGWFQFQPIWQVISRSQPDIWD